VFKSKQPSLRNFAVLERLERSRFGSVYSVQDRRTDQPSSLFIPSRIRAWPRYLEVFGEFDVSILRLRNGRIAFSLPHSVGVRELVEVVKKNSRSAITFDALNGFNALPQKAKRRNASLVFVLASVCIGALVWQGSTVAITQQTGVSKPARGRTIPACTNDSLVGELFSFAKGNHEILVKGIHLALKGHQQLGGYLQLMLTSQCDHKNFHLAAWFENKQYRITSVN